MAQTPEGKVKKMVNAALKSLGGDCYRFMPVQSGFGATTLDYLLAIRGKFVAIETKAPGKKLTPQQEGTKAAIEKAGGIVFVVWDETTLELAMKIILALEFAPNVPPDRYGVSALGAGFHAATAEEQGPRKQYMCQQLTFEEDD